MWLCVRVREFNDVSGYGMCGHTVCVCLWISLAGLSRQDTRRAAILVVVSEK